MYDKTTKSLIYKTAPITTNSTLVSKNNLLPSTSISSFTKENVTVTSVTTTPSFFTNILGSSVYKASTTNGTGKIKYTKEVNGLAADSITFIVWGKQLRNLSESGYVEVRLSAGDATRRVIFDKQTVDNNFAVLTVGLTPTVSYTSINAEIRINSPSSTTSIELGGVQLLSKAFGSFYQYDEKGNVVSSEGVNSETNITYNDDNQITEILGSDSSKSEISYDGKGRIENIVSAYGVTTKNTYDDNNNLKNILISSADGSKKIETSTTYTTDGRFVEYEYDELGNRTYYQHDIYGKVKKVIDALGATTDFDYDQFDCLKKLVLSKDDKSVQANYTYDDSHRVKTITLPNGTIYEFAYDNKDNLESVKINQNVLFKYAYDDYGTLESQKYGPNGIGFRFIHNSKSQLCQINYLNGSSEEKRFEFTYNVIGQMDTCKNIKTGITKTFAYDMDGKVIKISQTNNENTYSYDNLGNVNFSSTKNEGKSVYSSYDPVYRSKGSNPEALINDFQSQGHYLTAFFDNDARLKNAKYNIMPTRVNGSSISLTLKKDGAIPCAQITEGVSYQLNFAPSYMEASGAIAFWFKPTGDINDKYLFSTKQTNGKSFIGVYYSDDRLFLSGTNISGSVYTLTCTNGSINTSGWNYFSLNWINRNDGPGYDDICEYQLTLNSETVVYTKKNPRLYVEMDQYPKFVIGGKTNGNDALNVFPCQITALLIGEQSYFYRNTLQNYYRTTKDYIVDNEFVDSTVKIVDFSAVSHYTNDANILNQFEIYPLHNSVISLTGKKPIKFDLRKVISDDRDRTFNFNNKIKRYAYVADGSQLVYDFGVSKVGTIAMRACIDASDDKQYFMQSIDVNGSNIGLYRDSLNQVCLQFCDLTYYTNLMFPNNEWKTIALSYTNTSLSNPTKGPDAYFYDFRIYVDEEVFETKISTNPLGNFTTSIGRAVTGKTVKTNLGEEVCVYPLRGQIEMLAVSAAYCETSTLNSLRLQLNTTTKTSQFDDLGMLKKIDLHKNGNSILSNTLTYKTRSDSKYLSNFVAKEEIKAGSTLVGRKYETDALGNVITINDTTFGHKAYNYDYRGFLTRDKNETFTYDDNGNITKLEKITVIVQEIWHNIGGMEILEEASVPIIETTTYEYNSTFKDQLTSVNGIPITYDTNIIGNPKQYGDITYTFEGRRLVKLVNNGTNITYDYNEKGLRTKKTVGSTVTKYYYDNDRLVTEITPSYRNDFLYDENGQLYGFIYNNTTRYYYIRDFLQNILGIVDSSGTIVVKYDCNAYGTIISTTGSLATTIGKYNPFRYKGYYYDEDSQMYYCKTRYYNPSWCRWLNFDSFQCLEFDNINNINLYAYCANNPVMYSDGSGNWPKWVSNAWKGVTDFFSSDVGKIVGSALIIGGLGLLTLATGGAAAGSLLVAVNAVASGAFYGALTGAIIGGVVGGATALATGEDFLSGIANGMFSGTVSGAVTGALTGGVGHLMKGFTQSAHAIQATSLIGKAGKVGAIAGTHAARFTMNAIANGVMYTATHMNNGSWQGLFAAFATGGIGGYIPDAFRHQFTLNMIDGLFQLF